MQIFSVERILPLLQFIIQLGIPLMILGCVVELAKSAWHNMTK